MIKTAADMQCKRFIFSDCVPSIYLIRSFLLAFVETDQWSAVCRTVQLTKPTWTLHLPGKQTCNSRQRFTINYLSPPKHGRKLRVADTRRVECSFVCVALSWLCIVLCLLLLCFTSFESTVETGSETLDIWLSVFWLQWLSQLSECN